ncbi:hypothetical protein GCM10025857_60460 [Alicyclobacillus contaminans]|nr:hypothetical protein GCM10025857_60460 [Alicyclobacillus contaminans]
MNDIYINLIMSTIIENFGTEEAFYQDRLGVSSARWQDWKKGFSTLSAEEMQKIKNLLVIMNGCYYKRYCDKRLFIQKNERLP